MDSSVEDLALIEGVEITQLREITDERGSVLHMLRCDAPEFLGFGESYFSEVMPGAIKAWKRHLRQTQNIAVPIGRIRLAIYDDRESSQTRGIVSTTDLGRPDAYLRVLIPPGLWYGFTCVSATPSLVANCTDLPYDPGESEVRPKHDAYFPYAWSREESIP